MSKSFSPALTVHEAEFELREVVRSHNAVASALQRLEEDGHDAGEISEEALSKVLLGCSDRTQDEVLVLIASSGASCGDGRVDRAKFVRWLYQEEVERKTEARDLALERRCARAGMADLLGGRARAGFRIERTEERAITLPQLRALLSHVSRRCAAEGWMSSNPAELRELRPSTINLYDMVYHVVKPATRVRRCSFVELVAEGAQLPKWFVSHWWGEPVTDFVACLAQHSEDRKLDGASPYWVCAYANNQWELGGEISDDPAKTSFSKALQIADGTVSVLDREAVCYSRAWCGYEVYVSLLAKARADYKYDMYTTVQDCPEDHHTNAVGITDGVVEADCWRLAKYWKENKVNRERAFPATLARGALRFRVQDAQASQESDRRRILNAIAGERELNAQPLADSERYEVVNQMLRGRFAAATWRIAVEQGSSMEAFCAALRSSRLASFSMSFDECEPFDVAALELLSDALPETLCDLDLDFTNRALPAAAGNHLGRGLAGLRGLVSLRLTLHGNDLRAGGARPLSTGLAELQQLSALSLDLGNNQVGDEGASYLGECIGCLQRLTSLTLDLTRNRLYADAAKHLVAGLEKLPQVVTLNLSFRDNRLGNKGASHLGLGLQNISRTLNVLQLNLYGNQLEDEGAKCIGEGIKTLHQLNSLTLWMNYNFLGGEGAEYLKESIGCLKNLTSKDFDAGQGSGGLVMG